MLTLPKKPRRIDQVHAALAQVSATRPVPAAVVERALGAARTGQVSRHLAALALQGRAVHEGKGPSSKWRAV
jgi:hypothetical protein